MCVTVRGKAPDSVLNSCQRSEGKERSRRETADWGRTDAEPQAALPGSAPDMQSLISPVTKAILVALFIFAILLILYVILWYICRDVDCDHGIWGFTFHVMGRTVEPRVTRQQGWEGGSGCRCKDPWRAQRGQSWIQDSGLGLYAICLSVCSVLQGEKPAPEHPSQ